MLEASDMQDVRVVHFGVGPLGAAIARLVATRDGLVSVAAIDDDPDREGRDLAEIAGLSAPTGVTVEATSANLGDLEADVVLHVADDDRDVAIIDLEACLEAGLNVISVFPELAYPPDDDESELASSIDTLASETEVSALALDPSDALLGTLPLVLTGRAGRVDRITVRYHGAADDVGHSSAADWAQALAGALGWALDEADEEDEPTAGPAAGRYRFAGRVEGREVLVVELAGVASGAAPTLDVEVEGAPSFSMSVRGGTTALEAIATLVVNAIPAILTSEPGLYTVPELPPVHYWTSLGLLPAGDDEDEDE